MRREHRATGIDQLAAKKSGPRGATSIGWPGWRRIWYSTQLPSRRSRETCCWTASWLHRRAIAASGTWLAWGVSVVRGREVDDPHELVNVFHDPAYASVRAELGKVLKGALGLTKSQP